MVLPLVPSLRLIVIMGEVDKLWHELLMFAEHHIRDGKCVRHNAVFCSHFLELYTDHTEPFKELSQPMYINHEQGLND